MFDLNVSWPADISVAQSAAGLGYSGVAYDVHLAKESHAHVCPIKPHDPLQFSPSTLKGLTRFQSTRKLTELNLSCPSVCGPVEGCHIEFLQLKRLTVTVTHINQISALNNLTRTNPEYDLLAATPVDEKTWQGIVSNADCDIILLDLCKGRLEFALKRSQLRLAVSRGLFFEVRIVDALKDVSCRRHLFQNIQPIARFVPAKHLIFTSGASDSLDLRGPNEMAALAAMMGFSGAQGGPRSVVSNNCISVFHKGAARRSGGAYVMHLSVQELKQKNEKVKDKISDDDDSMESEQ